MIRSVVALVAALSLAGCGAMNLKRSVADEDLKKTRRVGVVSALGDTFNGVYVGTTVFTNKTFTAAVPEWSVDKYAVGEAIALLRGNGRFESAELDRTGLSSDQLRADGGKRLWEAAEKQGFDKLVLVRPGVSDNFPFFTPGVGFYERSMFGLVQRCVYAAYVVDVYDVATRKPVAWEWGGGAPCAFGGDKQLVFKAKFDDYSAEEKQQIRQRLEAWIATSMKYSLETLTLAPVTTAAKR